MDHQTSKEQIPQSPYSILEIGPGISSIAEQYYENMRLQRQTNIVFVDLNPIETSNVPDVTLVQANVIDYLLSDHESIPAEGFDEVVAMNVFGAPSRLDNEGIFRRFKEFSEGLRNHMKPTGKLIIEEYSTAGKSERLIRILTEQLGNEGFVVQRTENPEDFINPREAGFPRSFQLVVTKKQEEAEDKSA